MKYTIGGCWGCHVQWLNKEQFKKKRLRPWNRFSVHGHHSRIPQRGDLLEGDFRESTKTFKFTDVKQMRDPRDQFFAKVKLVKTEKKLQVSK